MSAAEESSLNIKTLGVIAGGGDIPARLLKACDKKGIEPFVVAFDGQTDPAVYNGRAYLLTRPGAAGHIIKTLKAHEIKDLVLIGSMRRPTLAELKPDLKAAAFFARVGFKALGDDGLLKALRKTLENEGFTIHGVQAFTDDLLSRPGLLSRKKTDKHSLADIRHGARILRATAPLDIGQSVVVQEGIVLGIEAAEGTDELIKRCSAYVRKGRGPVLVKMCKPQQDRKIDLPTIGPETVERCAEYGFSGIAIEAGHSLVLDADLVRTYADKHRMFVLAFDPEKDLG